MTSIRPSRWLVNALRLDAAASGTLALLQGLGRDALSAATGLPPALLAGTAGFLAGYAVLLLVLAAARRLPSALVWCVVLGNVAWALGCVEGALGAAGPVPPLGLAFLAFHAVGVLGFAVLETVGLRRSLPADAAPIGSMMAR